MCNCGTDCIFIRLLCHCWPACFVADDTMPSSDVDEMTTTPTSSKVSSGTVDGAPVSPSGSSDANHNLNSKPAALLRPAHKDDPAAAAVGSDFLVRRSPSSPPSLARPAAAVQHHVKVDRPEEDVEEAEEATEPEEEDEEEVATTNNSLASTDDIAQRIKYFVHIDLQPTVIMIPNSNLS